MGNKCDYVYDHMAEFYEDKYAGVIFDVPFWIDVTKGKEKILEIACGTGRITIPLLQDNKKVYALDYSEKMLNILKEKVKNQYPECKDKLIINKGDMRNFQLNEKFDIILITTNSLNHIEKNEDIDKTFNSLREQLTENGIVVFDIINPNCKCFTRDPEGIYNLFTFKHSKTNGYFKAWENNIYSAKEQIDYVTYYYQLCNRNGKEIDDKIVKIRLKYRMFYPQEMDYIINANRFEIIDKFDWYDRRVWDGKTCQQIYVIRKKNIK